VHTYIHTNAHIRIHERTSTYRSSAGFEPARGIYTLHIIKYPLFHIDYIIPILTSCSRRRNRPAVYAYVLTGGRQRGGCGNWFLGGGSGRLCFYVYTMCLSIDRSRGDGSEYYRVVGGSSGLSFCCCCYNTRGHPVTVFLQIHEYVVYVQLFAQ